MGPISTIQVAGKPSTKPSRNDFELPWELFDSKPMPPAQPLEDDFSARIVRIPAPEQGTASPRQQPSANVASIPVRTAVASGRTNPSTSVTSATTTAAPTSTAAAKSALPWEPKRPEPQTEQERWADEAAARRRQQFSALQSANALPVRSTAQASSGTAPLDADFDNDAVQLANIRKIVAVSSKSRRLSVRAGGGAQPAESVPVRNRVNADAWELGAGTDADVEAIVAQHRLAPHGGGGGEPAVIGWQAINSTPREAREDAMLNPTSMRFITGSVLQNVARNRARRQHKVKLDAWA